MHRNPTIQSIPILTGADQIEKYLPLLKNKRTAFVLNPTSQIHGVLLVDTLQKSGVKISKAFILEHGLSGKIDAGEFIGDYVDPKTGIQLISLYGKKKKPTSEDLKNIDVVVYDIQDVGVRFFTYISSLKYILEACAELHIHVIILDRPNPLGHLVEGPVLDTSLSSFVGTLPIPIIYGMTPGELAQMIRGEAWIPFANQLKLTIIPCKNYHHNLEYFLPVRPSPNLKSQEAIYLYPSLCLMEGTTASVGRGTSTPFRMYGSPDFQAGDFYFIPVPQEGASQPMYQGEECRGRDLSLIPTDSLRHVGFTLKYVIDAYQSSKNKSKFFLPNGFFDKLSGVKYIRKDILAGKSEKEIKKKWKKELSSFKKKRAKYLLYAE